MPIDAGRAIANLRQLDRLTGGPEGARRVCWTDEWVRARDFLRERLAEIDGVAAEQDEAGNLWASLPGERDGAVAVGSHLDSVPQGGWLDGALGVMAGLEVLHAAGEEARSVTCWPSTAWTGRAPRTPRAGAPGCSRTSSSTSSRDRCSSASACRSPP